MNRYTKQLLSSEDHNIHTAALCGIVFGGTAEEELPTISDKLFSCMYDELCKVERLGERHEMRIMLFCLFATFSNRELNEILREFK